MSLGLFQRIAMSVLVLTGLCAAQVAPTTAFSALPSAPSATRAVYRPSPAERYHAPLSAHEKFRRFARSLYSPYTFVSGAYDATWDQATGGNYGYGGGMEGWGKRLGSAYAGTAANQFFGFFLFPAVLHQDPRYFPMYEGSTLSRVKYAVSRLFITRSDDGRRELNASRLLAIVATASAENLWLPARERTAGDTANRMLGGLQGTATSYLLREFTPDLVHFFQHHAPRSLRRMEEKIPAQLISGTPKGEE